MLSSEIKHLVFDMDLTLVHVRPNTVHFIQSHLESHGIEMTRSQINAAGRWYSKFWVDPPPMDWEDKENLASNRRAFWMKFLKQYYLILNKPEGSLDDVLWEIASLMETREVEDYVLDDTYQILSQLRERGYVMSVLSNRYNPISPVITEMGLAPYFGYAHSAGELGETKPNKEIFEKHLRIIQASPEETAYVGDNYWLDVLGAESAGIQAILFDRFGWYDKTDCLRIEAISDLINRGS